MRLAFKIIKDNINRLLLALIGIAVVSTICLMSFVDLERKTEVYNSLYSFLPADSIVIKFNNGSLSEADEDKIVELSSAIAEMQDIETLVPFCPRTLYLCDDKTDNVYCFQIYDSDINCDFEFEILDGRAPAKNANEVLISEDAAKEYSIGDVIHVQVVDWIMNDTQDEPSEEYYQSADLTVVGIVDNHSRLISPDGADATPLDLIESRVSECLEMGMPLLFSYGCEDVNGNIVEHKYEYDIAYTSVVKLKKGVSSSEAIKSINEQIKGYGYAKPAREFVNEAIDAQWKDYRPLIGVGLAALFIMTITLISIYVFQIKKGMKALISYYICGCTWNRIVLTLCLINIPTTLLGLLCGVIYFRNSTALFDDVVLTKSAVLGTTLLIVGIQAIISVIFFLALHRISPVEIRRMENE